MLTKLNQFNYNLPKKYRRYSKKISMTGWYIWQTISVTLPLIFYSTFLYALVWSEVTGYNQIREEAIFNSTGVDKRFMKEWKYLTRWDHMVQLLLWFVSVIVAAQRLFKFRDDHKNLSNSIELHIDEIKNRTKLQIFQDFYFHALAHPLSIVITLLYWSMKLYDPSLLSASSPNVPDTPIILDHIAVSSY